MKLHRNKFLAVTAVSVAALAVAGTQTASASTTFTDIPADYEHAKAIE